MAEAAFRAGYAALVGPPNAGKSTLMNRILGEKLAIVSARPQTTRSRILGIHGEPGAQLLLLDTPGLHESQRLLNRSLNDAVHDALEDCDVAWLLVDRSRGFGETHAALLASIRATGKPCLLVGTKCDQPAAAGPWPPPEWPADAPAFEVSGRTGEGVAELLAATIERLPEGPPLFPEEQLTDRPLRWLAGELVRESAFERLGAELPYAMAVDVVDFDESRPDLIRIRANLLVERNSQKRIVVGKGGAMIKEIGIRARKAIERLVGLRVHLELHVKIDPRWGKSPGRIEALGYGGRRRS